LDVCSFFVVKEDLSTIGSVYPHKSRKNIDVIKVCDLHPFVKFNAQKVKPEIASEVS